MDGLTTTNNCGIVPIDKIIWGALENERAGVVLKFGGAIGIALNTLLIESNFGGTSALSSTSMLVPHTQIS